MKKHLILFLMAGFIGLTSCSKDDDEDTENDPIIGTWALVSVNPPNQFFNPEACSEQSTITFTDNNTATGTFYMSNNNCIAQNSAGVWSNVGDSTYSLTSQLIGNQEFIVNFEGSASFSINFNGAQLVFERQ